MRNNHKQGACEMKTDSKARASAIEEIKTQGYTVIADFLQPA